MWKASASKADNYNWGPSPRKPELLEAIPDLINKRLSLRFIEATERMYCSGQYIRLNTSDGLKKYFKSDIVLKSCLSTNYQTELL